ncbi:2-succinyl-5-enolpyruvyl-6-hydroxy-3-cyclohexene-1-carboxylic-acid synthase [Conexibacter sp. DBS9H8]|uniref:2-succinyl-5-enolpyruvyl-6-hydroxy-3- cyclohexene-1-carboxylic-acid synthase n=1 Tax=Conexibacter sp. DBS9H8 TaxID=2937801 RepID=UPI0020107547|nr:2-succinyl-5-enolpyruvyl-6-hydroxy-3-cyclohexene-1-carboxylic-acid synthase [Conexibacter sp. DBS9H8]
MTATAQHLLLRALVDELARCGTEIAVTAAGSRNTPVIEALVADERIRSVSHIDERCGGFFAVGAARASGRPVVVTVTSGSAVANLMPAVVEASEAGVPLIVLSADRPPELRQIGAGQTIDQVKLFGVYCRFFAELDLSEATPDRLAWVRSLACRAYLTALGPHPGPVQLNLPLREPLVVARPLPEDPPGGQGRPDGRPWVSAIRGREPADPIHTPPVSRPPQTVPAVVVLGGGLSPSAGRLWARLAARAGLPVLADPLSGGRTGPAAIAHYDLILRHADTAAALAPELILRGGDLPTSKPLRAWLAGLGTVEQIVAHPRPEWPDPTSQMSRRVLGDAALALNGLAGPPGWLAAWQAADATVAAGIAPVIDASGLSEPAVARCLGADLPPEATLFVAASMPIRDVEEFVAARERPPRVLANRGANGIDGTVSSALGAAAVSDGPVVLLIGDVALAHDIGGLLTARRAGVPLTVVLLNNDGGGIFAFLAIAGASEAYAEHVATPHGLDFAHAAALYGLDHHRPGDLAGLRAVLADSIHQSRQGGSATVIEVRTEREANRVLHAEIAAAAAAALSRRGPAATPGA